MPDPATRMRTAPPFQTNKGVQFYAKDSDGQWHYVNHAGTWQGCPVPVAADQQRPDTRFAEDPQVDIAAIHRTIAYREACERLLPSAAHREVIAKCRDALYWAERRGSAEWGREDTRVRVERFSDLCRTKTVDHMREARLYVLLGRLHELAAEGKGMDAVEVRFLAAMLPVDVR
jgi:hypothetical protein